MPQHYKTPPWPKNPKQKDAPAASSNPYENKGGTFAKGDYAKVPVEDVNPAMMRGGRTR